MNLKTAIRRKKISEIRNNVKPLTISEITDIYDDLSQEDKLIFFRSLTTELQGDVFNALDIEHQESLIKTFTDKQLTTILDELYTDDIVDIIEEVPEELVKRILKAVDKEEVITIKKLLRYKEKDTGSIMNVNIVNIKQNMTISSARKYIRQNREDKYIPNIIFVTDAKNKLVGSIRMEDLLFSNPKLKVSKVMVPTAFVYTTTPKEEAANAFADHDRSVLPVLNNKKEVIGIITSDDIIDIVQTEIEDDIAKMSGIQSNKIANYSKSSTLSIVRSRIFWLLLLLITATFSHFLVAYFDNQAKHLQIALFTTVMATIPLVMDTAGNAGSQTSATITRALALGDVTTKDYLKVFWKELKVSSTIGLIMGIANFARMMIIFSIQYPGDATWNDLIILSIGLSLALMIIIILAKILGGMLPILAKKVGGDPAVMASPMLTTLIDILALGILFGISYGIILLL